MNRTTKAALAGVALSAALMGAVAGPAAAWVSVGAKTQYPSEGGTWEYGFWDVKLRSYYTVNKCHGSTVVKYIDGKETNRSRSIDTVSGKKSIAEISTVNSAGLEASYYYRTC
ncbi:lactococcin 972 family bacteriocin [Micromonospora sp. NPDC007271]|uniref:lactococcin 972 family bacteriocin n=1 Tax=Micromonospora sp. NPDC007271 TaxID=3154587 RepID=UPI0033EE4799